MAKNKNNTRNIITIVLIVILCAVVVFSAFKIFEATRTEPVVGDDTTSSKKTITVDGVDDFPRQDITVLMLMGIDERCEV